jgi:hypothetical protein
MLGDISRLGSWGNLASSQAPESPFSSEEKVLHPQKNGVLSILIFKKRTLEHRATEQSELQTGELSCQASLAAVLQ